MIKIDDKEYDLDALSQEAKNQVASLHLLMRNWLVWTLRWRCARLPGMLIPQHWKICCPRRWV